MNKKDIKIITSLFIVSRLLLIIFLIINHKVNNYDALNYIEIAKNGYSSESLYAFFPLFPLLIRLFHIIIPSYEIASIILSNLFSYLSILVLYKLLENNKNKHLIIFGYIFSPILVYNCIGYTESLYLLLTFLAYYFYKENKYIKCGIILGLSMITRNTGIVLLGAIGLHMLYRLYKKEITFKEIVILFVPAAIIGFSYSMYLFVETKDFFKYITSQYTDWNKEHCNIISLLIKDTQFLINNFDIICIYVYLQNWIFIIFGLILGIKQIKKEQVLSIYLIASLLLITTTCRNSNWMSLPTISFFRYTFSLISIYLLFNIKDDNRLIKNPITISLFIAISIINSLLAFNGVFIA